MEVSEVVLENLVFGGWMSLSQIKTRHPARLLLRIAWLWEVEMLAGRYPHSSYHSLIYINQIKHVLCFLRSSTKIKWKAATALHSVTRPQCLLFACSCQFFITNMQVQGHV